MRSILNTTLKIGMVNVPVKVFSATSSHDIEMHQYHESDKGRIRYERVCEIDDEPVSTKELVKGFETEEGEVVLLDDADFEQLPVSSKLIEVLAFVPAGQIDPVYYEKSYYLGPGTAGTEPYLVLREALAESGRVALATFTMRQRESLAAIRVLEKTLVLDTLLWADEVHVPEVHTAGEFDQGELDMAAILIDARSGDWNPEEYADTYQQALLERVEALARGQEPPRAERQRRPKVVSLMDALEKSVAAVDPDRLPPPKKAARKAAKKAARKTPRKTGEKSAAAKAATRKRAND
jgi:DNA end-binding protein Ku